MNFDIAKHKAVLLERTDLKASHMLMISAFVLTLQTSGHHCQQLKEGIRTIHSGGLQRWKDHSAQLRNGWRKLCLIIMTWLIIIWWTNASSVPPAVFSPDRPFVEKRNGSANRKKNESDQQHLVLMYGEKGKWWGLIRRERKWIS